MTCLRRLKLRVDGFKIINGEIGANTIYIGCDCGMCSCRLEEDCIRDKCKCCANFHERSGIKR